MQHRQYSPVPAPADSVYLVLGLSYRREVADKFRSTFGTTARPLNELQGKQKRVARSPLMHRDSKLSMSRKSSGLKVEATCPYCKGGGCRKCNSTGTI